MLIISTLNNSYLLWCMLQTVIARVELILCSNEWLRQIGITVQTKYDHQYISEEKYCYNKYKKRFNLKLS